MQQKYYEILCINNKSKQSKKKKIYMERELYHQGIQIFVYLLTFSKSVCFCFFLMGMIRIVEQYATEMFTWIAYDNVKYSQL